MSRKYIKEIEACEDTHDICELVSQYVDRAEKAESRVKELEEKIVNWGYRITAIDNQEVLREMMEFEEKGDE